MHLNFLNPNALSFQPAPKFHSSALLWLFAGAIGISIGFATTVITGLPPKVGVLAILAFLFMFTVIVHGDIRKFLLIVIIFDIPFPLDVHLGFRHEVEALGSLPGWNLSVTTASVAILYALWLVEFFTKSDKGEKIGLFAASLPLTIYMIFVGLSSFAAADMQLSFFKCFMLMQIYLVFIYIVGNIKTREDFEYVITLILLGLIFQSLLIISLSQIGHTIEFAGLKAVVDPGPRIGGTVGGPNSAGSYLSFLLVPAISILLTDVSKHIKYIAAAAFSLGFVALVLTLSRGGMLAFTIGAAIFCLVAWLRGWISLKIPILLVLTAAVLLIPVYQLLVARLSGDDAGSAYSRIPLIELAFNVIKDKLISGVGVNNFSIVMGRYISTGLRGMWLYTVHNKYLLVWAEIGTFGIISFLGFLGTTLFRGWRASKSSDKLVSILALAFVVSIIGHMTHMMVDTFDSRPAIQMLWVAAGLVTALYYFSKGTLQVNLRRDKE